MEYELWNIEYGIWNMCRPTIGSPHLAWAKFDPFFIWTQNIWTKFLVCKVQPVDVPSSTRSVIYVFKVVHMQTVTITHVRQIFCFELDFFTFI